ncbi:rhodanese-like domain-containing protein [Methanocella sp. MCL-LM]|uniref:rhodanese-like domain-containing protein n=1 Tax=Methanocella sp. MCL-LM TaxID=3412035 RepID=UPI003C760858
MMSRYRWSALVLAVIILISGSFLFVATASDTTSQMAQSRANGHYMMTTDELYDMLRSKDFTLVNVHVPYEGELSQTDLFIPYTEIDQHLDSLPADKNAKIVLYCKTDRMSGIAAARLAELGYTNVWDVRGGMIEWKQKGYPIYNTTF